MKTINQIYLRLFALLMLSPLLSFSADYYWVGGSGNWSDYANHWATSSGGSSFHASIPTLNDNVFVDNNSFTATGQTLLLDSTFYYCKSMDWTGVQFSPELQGNGAILYIYGSLILDPNMTISQTDLVFRANGPGNTVTTSNHVLERIYFEGSGDYSLGDNLNCLQDINLVSGSLDANSFDITCRSVISEIGSTLTTGDINLNLDGRWNDAMTTRKVELKGTVLNTSSTNLFFHCNIGSVIGYPNPMIVDSITFTNTGSVQFATANYLYLPGSCNVYQSNIGRGDFGTASDAYLTGCTFDTLQGKNFVFNGDTTTITVNNLFEMRSDCNGLGEMRSFNSPSGYGVLNVPSGNVVVNWVKMSGIHTAGGATFTANNVIDNGNNAGWTLNALTSRNMYWIGGSGNWNDPNHWSLSSGGGTAGCSPTQLDNVFFDNNSFSGNDTISTNEYDYAVNSLTFSGLTTSPLLQATFISVHGSLTLDPLVRSSVISFRFLSDLPGQTITTSGVALNYADFLGSGSYQLQDSLFASEIYVESGSLDMNSYRMDANIINAYSGTTLDATNATLSSKELTLNGTVTGSAFAHLLFNRNNGVLFEPGNFQSITFMQDGVILSPVSSHSIASSGTLEIDSSCTFVLGDFYGETTFHADMSIDSLSLFNSGFALNLDSGTTLSIANTIVTYANCNSLISIRSSSSGDIANISSPSGNHILDYVQIRDINATGGGTFTANNSVDAGNNSGWTINSIAPRTVYWVGGNGNWSDPIHWSLSSGGGGGACAPTAVDIVIIDQNSGLSGGTLTMDVSNASASIVNFQNAGANVTVSGDNLSVFNSIYLTQGMNWNLQNLYLNPSNTGGFIQTDGTALNYIVVDGTGTIQQNDPTYATELNIHAGSFDVNGFDLSASSIHSAPGTNFLSGPVTLTVANFYIEGSISNTNSTDVVCQIFPPAHSINGMLLFRCSGTFRDITVMNDGLTFLMTDVNCRVLTAYGDMSYSGYASIDTIQKVVAFGNLTFQFAYTDTLFLNNPGKTVNMAYSVTIGSELIANGTPAFPVLIQGGNSMNLIKSSGQVCLSDVILSNVPASGGAQFYAGQGCVDLGGNTGWQFTPCTVLSDVWPGDANYDLDCNNLDILNIGIAFGETGPVRSGASLAWAAQPANDFGNWFSSAVNMKHADCDGNGVVDYADTLAVNQNYSLNHPARLSNLPNHINSVLPPLTLVASPDTVAPSATVFVDVMLGEQNLPVDSLYGIAFSVFYDPSLINGSSLHADFTGSWLGTIGTDMIGFVKNNVAESRVDFALCRTDHQNIYGGFGHLVLFDVVVVDNISTISDALFSISNVTALTYTQYSMAIGRLNDTITINPLLGVPGIKNPTPQFFIFPNPAKDKVTVLAHDANLKMVKVYDMQGREVISENPGVNEFTLELGELSSGIYEIRCITDQGDYHSRLQVNGR